MRLKSPFFAYKIGFAVLGLFTAILCAYVLVQASGNKQDAQTIKSATSIAEKLNTYIEQKETIPASLSQVGATDVPATISYQKLSDSSYKFCVTYKTKSLNFDAGSAALSIASGTQPYTSNYAGDDSSLYISSSHPKGQQCQTIKPAYLSTSIYNSSGASIFGGTGSKTLDPYTACGNVYSHTVAAVSIQAITATTVQVDDTAAGTTYQISPSTKVYNSTCKSLQLSDLKADDFVDLFSATASGPVTTIVKY